MEAIDIALAKKTRTLSLFFQIKLKTNKYINKANKIGSSMA
jgi:hypothetical protein